MSRSIAWASAAIPLVLLARPAPQDPTPEVPVTQTAKEKAHALLRRMCGTWEGTCRTWFQPGKLADESSVRGVIEARLGSHILRHTYEGSMSGKPRSGEETIAFQALEGVFQVSWFDTFHMNYGLLFSEGPAIDAGFAVHGRYRMAPDQAWWGWRTEYVVQDDDHLAITAYNILPDGREAKAVETLYTRVPR